MDFLRLCFLTSLCWTYCTVDEFTTSVRVHPFLLKAAVSHTQQKITVLNTNHYTFLYFIDGTGTLIQMALKAILFYINRLVVGYQFGIMKKKMLMVIK